METRLELEILPQPDNVTCGPTCLHSVFRFYGDDVSLESVVRETPQLDEGGTLAVLLGCHALRRGYQATIYTWNLQVFDPTWFQQDAPPLADRLRMQIAAKEEKKKIVVACQAYLEFLSLGGTLRMEEFNGTLFRKYLRRQIPLLTGLSSTYLYRCSREFGPDCEPDDVRGVPSGHFVVLCGYDPDQRLVLVADPLLPNPLGHNHYYEVEVDRVIRAILLGVLTYDANVLVIQPKKDRRV